MRTMRTRARNPSQTHKRTYGKEGRIGTARFSKRAPETQHKQTRCHYIAKVRLNLIRFTGHRHHRRGQLSNASGFCATLGHVNVFVVTLPPKHTRTPDSSTAWRRHDAQMRISILLLARWSSAAQTACWFWQSTRRTMTKTLPTA